MPEKIARLVEYQRSDETVRACRELLVDAMEGKLIGLAYIAMYQKPAREYEFDVVGETRKSPIMTRGYLPELDHELGKILHGEK